MSEDIKTLRFDVDTAAADGKTCVKQLGTNETGTNVVVVDINKDGSVTSAKKEETLTIPGAETGTGTGMEEQKVPEKLDESGGGFSMKSLSRGLFGSKKSKKHYKRNVRSVKRSRSIRKSRRNRSKRSGKRR